MGGIGKLLGGVPGVRPARVLIIGGGVVGTQSARMAVGLGCEVCVLERSVSRLRQLDDLFQGRIVTRFSNANAIESEAANADVIVGAALIPGSTAPKLLSKKDLGSLKKGAVLVDVSIDQGGCFETSRPTSHADPTFTVDGIVHYCVANMPGSVPLTSSEALNNATLPFGLRLATEGLAALRSNPHLLAGLNILDGRITHPAVATSLNMEFVDPRELLRIHLK